jgi:hypothetical protein
VIALEQSGKRREMASGFKKTRVGSVLAGAVSGVLCGLMSLWFFRARDDFDGPQMRPPAPGTVASEPGAVSDAAWKKLSDVPKALSHHPEGIWKARATGQGQTNASVLDWGGGASPTFSFRDLFQSAHDVLSQHDKHVDEAVFAIQRDLNNPPGAFECGLARARRIGRSWAVQTRVLLDIVVRGQELTVTDVQFSTLADLEDGDLEFQRCFAQAVRGLSTACQPCREGRLSTPWPLGQIYNLPRPQGEGPEQED